MAINTNGGNYTSNQIKTEVKTFNPSDSQLTSFTRISYSEQGNDAGAAAEMSLILNKYYLAGHTDGDANNLYNYLYGNRWWRNSASVMDGTWGNCKNPSEDQKQKILKVLQGARTLPLYIDEHDFRGDISYIEGGNGSDIYNNNCYVQHKTVIHNSLGSTYTFYCFPSPESDPFGYTNAANREKFGDGIPSVGGTTPSGDTPGSSITSAVSGGLSLAGLTFSSGRSYERETAHVEEGSHPELKTFYRINMTGAQFIKQVLAPYCRSKATGQGAYRLWFSDETAPDGSVGIKLFFKPDQYNSLNSSMSDKLLPDIDKTYQFEFGSGPNSSVIEFSPNYNGMVTSVTGGYKVEGVTTNAITNDLMQVHYGKDSDDKRPSTGDSRFDDLRGTYRIGDSSYSIEDLQNRAANLWYNMSSYGYTADMTVLGDPLIENQSLCSVTVLTPSGIPHHSSGVYLVYHVTDDISGGSFTTTMSLVRNAIDIGVDESGGIDITISSGATTFIGEAASLMSGTYNDVFGGSGGTANTSNGSVSGTSGSSSGPQGVYSDTDYSDTIFLGDSMMAIRKSQLASAFPGATIYAKSGAPFDVVLGYANSIENGKNPNRVVVGTGNNDWNGISADQATQMTNVLNSKGAKEIYFIKMLVTNNKQSTENTNKAIDTVASQNNNVHIIDWNSAISSNPKQYLADNVHQNDEGFKLYIDLIRKAL